VECKDIFFLTPPRGININILHLPIIPFAMKTNIFLFAGFLCVCCSCERQKKDETKSEQLKPSATCAYSRDEKNPQGMRIRVVQSEKFISLPYADSASKALFKGRDFLSGYLSCVSVDTVLGIFFDFSIHTEDAYYYYGLIKKNNIVRFMLNSGKSVELRFGSTFSGNTNLSREYTEYSSFAYLPRSVAKQLMSEEVQSVMISWSKKEENYNVVNPRIFINQIPCVVR
jgi:hypothetical protein